MVNGRDGANIRIGDPNVTVTGRHRYRIEYPLPGVAPGTTLDWEAVGTAWEVGIEEAEIHVVAPFELLDATCSVGVTGSQGGCDVTEVAPGHLVTTVDGLDAGEGRVDRGAAPGATSRRRRPRPSHRPRHRRSGDRAGAARRHCRRAALLGADLLDGWYGGRVAARGRRWPGRRRLGWAGPRRRAGCASTRASSRPWPRPSSPPPADLDPPHGGIVLTEEVRPEHKVAWLIQMAIDGTVDIGGNGVDGASAAGAAGPWIPSGDDIRLVRTGHGTPDAAAILDTAFAGRDEVELGSYDSNFARAWRHLQPSSWRGATPAAWGSGGRHPQGDSPRAGHHRRRRGGAGCGRRRGAGQPAGTAWLILAAAGGGGRRRAGGRAAAWELRVRTPAGSAAWLRVESFRRFLAESGVPRRGGGQAASCGSTRPGRWPWARSTAGSGRCRRRRSRPRPPGCRTPSWRRCCCRPPRRRPLLRRRAAAGASAAVRRRRGGRRRRRGRRRQLVAAHA